MVRAAKLEPQVYEEVEADESTMSQAIGVVAVSSVAAGIGKPVLVAPVVVVVFALLDEPRVGQLVEVRVEAGIPDLLVAERREVREQPLAVRRL
jgi:hypothetical protein